MPSRSRKAVEPAPVGRKKKSKQQRSGKNEAVSSLRKNKSKSSANANKVISMQIRKKRETAGEVRVGERGDLEGYAC